MNTLLIQGYTNHKLYANLINIIEYYMNEIDRGLLHITKDIYMEMAIDNENIFKLKRESDTTYVYSNLIKDYSNRWDYIMYELDPNEDFILEFINEISWKTISASSKISQDFIFKYFNNLDHSVVYCSNKLYLKKYLNILRKEYMYIYIYNES